MTIPEFDLIYPGHLKIYFCKMWCFATKDEKSYTARMKICLYSVLNVYEKGLC